MQTFFLAYLVGWLVWLSLPFGALALFMIGYLTTASWGLVLRRIFQAATRTLPVVALLFLPIVVSLFLPGGSEARRSAGLPVLVGGPELAKAMTTRSAQAKGAPEQPSRSTSRRSTTT